MSNSGRFLGVLFDCDGVLVDSEVVGLDEVVSYLSGHGLSLDKEQLIRRFSGMRNDVFRTELLSLWTAVRGTAPSDSEANEFFEGVLAARRSRRDEMRAVDGAVAMVQSIAARRPVAVASSSAQNHLERKIDAYGFRPHFGGHVYSAQHVRAGKPEPDIFLYAAERLGIDPAKALVVEDSVHGVVAGVAAGCAVWGFVGGGHCLPDHALRLRGAGAEAIFTTHQELELQMRGL